MSTPTRDECLSAAADAATALRAFAEATEAARPSTRDECIAAAGAVLAKARLHVAEAYAAGGAMEVARQAWVPGGKSIEQLAAGYERLVQQARERPDAA